MGNAFRIGIYTKYLQIHIINLSVTVPADEIIYYILEVYMGRKAVKRVLAILMICAMTVSMAGCGGSKEGKSNGNTESSGNTVTKEADNSSQGGESTASTEGEVVSYPLNTKDELSIWSNVLKPEQSYTDYTQSPFHTGLAEKTGVQVKWEFPTEGSDATQAYNLMLAENNLPDIIWWTFLSSGDAKRLIDEGVIRDLSELLPKYAPNYWKFLQENEHFDKSMKTDEGEYFGFGSFREDAWQATYAGPVIRKDWLDALKLDIPQTIEEWDNVLKAFKDNYNATLTFATGRMSPGLASGFDTFGTLGLTTYLNTDGKVEVAQAKTEWKNYIAKLQEWYKEGLIDSDVATLDDTGVRTKALNNEVGASVTSIAQLSNWIADAKAEGTGAEWIGIPYPVETKGDVVHAIQAEDTVSIYCAAVSTSCPEEKLETALRWLDYGFTEEGFRYWNYGDEGKTYTMENGQPKFTSLIMDAPEGISSALDKYCGTQWTCIGIQAKSMVQQKNAAESVAAVDTWTANTDYQTYLYPAGVSMTTEESNEYSTVFNALNTYASEMSLKYLVGEESLDGYDKYVSKLQDMGLQRVIDIKQAAYDRFINR